jgi:thiol-disulfide isomerase/thioredoxin
MSETMTARWKRPVTWIAGLVALLAAAGILWLGLARPTTAIAQECLTTQAVTQRMAPLARGEVAALNVDRAPKQPPEIAFQGPNGATALSALRGKLALVNLWATWCVPCRQEMPALDRLQAELGGPDFEVVAINVDTRDPDKPKAWLKDNGIGHLAFYADPSGKVLQILQRSGHVVGLPTTILVDQTGCQLGVMKGPAEWASPDGIALIRAALGRTS